MTGMQRLHRDPLRVNVRVEEAESGRPLGHLVDLSLGGFCVSGPRPAVTGIGPVKVRLVLPWAIDGARDIPLEVVMRWARPVRGRQRAGYVISHCDDDALRRLSHLAARCAGRAG
ncbi:hypothetical protein S7S_11535 [Isoalcanivorax pacificus W11-5]|uniref:PilZ domain-containing protein n=2 Tax=Isoalcanivorax TaxID=3020833 RepID=A0A0B4XKB3_9GAMM|nr:hypothetical protein S7S_11535 [Isoalcanivorax pacificus W11-5]